MISQQSQQSAIVEWFNKTYASKGERYLRPVKAYFVFLELMRAQPNQHMLDVACGLGRLLEAAEDYQIRRTGIDISPVAIAKAKEKLPDASLHVGNAETLPFADEQFDMVTCLGSLERMLNVENVLREMHRVGTANASYCFLVRNANTPIWKYLKVGLNMRNKQGHQDAKTMAQWTTLFEQNGFDIKSVLPDQYPLQKRKKWLSLGLRTVNYREVIDDPRPLEQANEFIFVLRKKEAAR